MPPEETDDVAQIISYLLAGLAGIGLGVAVAYATPRLRAGWRRLLAQRHVGRERLAGAPKDSSAIQPGPPLTDPDEATNADVAQAAFILTTDEAKRILVEALVYLANADYRIRLLRHAELAEGASEDLRLVVEQACSSDAIESLNRALEARGDWLDPDLAEQLMTIYGGGREVDGLYVPLQRDRVRRVLGIPPDVQAGVNPPPELSTGGHADHT